MPMHSLLPAIRLFSSDGNIQNIQNISEASPNERNMYLNMLQQEHERQASIIAEYSAQAPYIPVHDPAAQQSSQVSPHWKILEDRLMQAEENILTLTRACQNLRTILEQYELINQELATQVIDLQANLKTP